jgi:hemolysin D
MSAVHEHWRAIHAALRADRDRSKARPLIAEPEFLPAALEVIEQPVSPTGRATSWALMGLLGVTALWLGLGRVDVVASASGKIVGSGNSKLVQSAGTGVVSAIRVHEGDHVRKGQVLLDLDTTLSSAELQQSAKALQAVELDVARNRAFIDAIDGKGLRFNPPEGTSDDVVATQIKLIAAQLAEVNAMVAGYGAARDTSLADARAAQATRARIDDTLPILDREVAAMTRLDEKGYAPGLRLLEMQRQRRSEQGEREISAAQIARGAAEARKYARQMAATREQARRQALADLAKAQGEAIVKREEVTKAARRKGLQHLVAPEEGSVQQLAVHTVGGVVEPARTLMVIVPSHDTIEVEARVLNKDMGFVHEGQEAAVKIEAFPFTRYGTVRGRVVSLSRDAVSDPKLGAVYIARIRLESSFIQANGKAVPLGAGLGVTADIRTGSRAIISWLLSPLMTSVSQAGHEQ